MFDDCEYIFNFLHDQFTLLRHIESFGVLKGTAKFNRVDKKSLHYFESGFLTLQNGLKLKAYKEYIYMLHDDGLFVYFSNNKEPQNLMHKLHIYSTDESNILRASAFHSCSPDQYIASYQFNDFLDNKQFTIKYDVVGPNKNFTIHSQYTRDH